MTRCANCKFWQKSCVSLGSGYCRCYSPEVLPDGDTVWPKTHGTDRCGEGQEYPETLKKVLDKIAEAEALNIKKDTEYKTICDTCVHMVSDIDCDFCQGSDSRCGMEHWSGLGSRSEPNPEYDIWEDCLDYKEKK